MFGRTLRKLFLFFFLEHSKVNLQTSIYNFYKSAALTNIKSAALGTVS